MIEPGWEGSADDETLRVCRVLDPQSLLAVTDMVPPVAPTVAFIEVEVELPLHPDGRVHV